ncbi:MAG TPA: MFS transporter [Micromonosporaceae bacterium]|jgi:MFS family permease|nr:MFS transporter [Micromonosporaceae bacterium]
MSALRHPRFRRLLIGESVSSFGDSAMFLSLGVWAKDLTNSNTAAGLVFLFLTGPQLAAPLLGHLADRVGRRELMIWSNVFGIALVLSLLGVSDRGDLWRLYVVAVGYALLSALPARGGLLKDMLPSEDAASGQSLLSSVGQGTRILSPIVGTGIYVAAGGGTLAIVDAATFAIAIVALLSIKVTESPVEEITEPFVRRLTAGFRHVRSTPLLLQLTVALTAFLAVGGLLETGLFAAIQYGIHRSPAFYGVLLSIQGAGTIVGAVFAPKVVRKFGEARTTGIGSVVLAVGMVLGILLPTVASFVIAMVLFGAALGLIFVAFGTAQQLYTPGRLAGRVGAAMGTLMSIAQTASIAIGAVIVGVVDWRLMFALPAVTAFGCGLSVLVRPAAAPAVVASLADSAVPADLEPAAVA